MIFNRIVVPVCLAVLLTASVHSLADAKWFGKKEVPENDPARQIQTFQPPPENAMLMYCEPYRKEAAELAGKNALMKAFFEPRRMWLMSEYRKCTNELMTQEHQYLKHVDIELAPSLPKMKPVVQPINQPEKKQGVPNGTL